MSLARFLSSTSARLHNVFSSKNGEVYYVALHKLSDQKKLNKVYKKDYTTLVILNADAHGTKEINGLHLPSKNVEYRGVTMAEEHDANDSVLFPARRNNLQPVDATKRSHVEFSNVVARNIKISHTYGARLDNCQAISLHLNHVTTVNIDHSEMGHVSGGYQLERLKMSNTKTQPDRNTVVRYHGDLIFSPDILILSPEVGMEKTRIGFNRARQSFVTTEKSYIIDPWADSNSYLPSDDPEAGQNVTVTVGFMKNFIHKAGKPFRYVRDLVRSHRDNLQEKVGAVIDRAHDAVSNLSQDDFEREQERLAQERIAQDTQRMTDEKMQILLPRAREDLVMDQYQRGADRNLIGQFFDMVTTVAYTGHPAYFQKPAGPNKKYNYQN